MILTNFFKLLNNFCRIIWFKHNIIVYIVYFYISLYIKSIIIIIIISYEFYNN